MNDAYNLNFETNNTTRMTIDSTSGNVGLGTTSPNASIHTQKTTLTGTVSASGTTVTGSGTNFLSSLSVGDEISIYDSGSQQNRIISSISSNTSLTVSSSFSPTLSSGSTIQRVSVLLSSGYLGLGTTSPNYDIHVKSSKSDTMIVAENTNANGYAVLRARSDAGDMSVGMNGSSVNSGTAFIWNTANTDILIATNDTEQMRIKNDGKVGIGTSSPGAKLEVAGQVKITGGSPGSGKVLTSDASGLATWQTPAAGGITSLNGLSASSQTFAIGTAGTAPAFSSATSTHTLNIPMASTASVTAGLLSKTDYDTFNAKLGTGTSFSGDVSGNYNSTSVDKIKGTAVSITSLTSGNFLKYNGTNWVNTNLTSGDIPSIDLTSGVTGTLPIGNGGTGATTAAAARTALGLGTAAVKDTGSAAGYVPLLGTGGLTANKLCTADGTAAGIICTSTIPTSSQWTTTGSDIYYNTGKVGIGNSSPQYTFDVTGNAHIIGDVSYENNSVNANAPNFNFWKSRNYAATAANDNLGYIYFWGHDGSALRQGAFISSTQESVVASSIPANLVFGTAASGDGSPSERMRIMGSGNVGIGATAPAQLLEVNGNVRVGSQTTRATASSRGQLALGSTYVQTTNSSVTIDWDKGNIQELNTFVCDGSKTITFSNARDGASYTLLITGTGAHSGTCNFSGGTFKASGGNVAPTASKDVLFTFVVINSTIVYNMIDNLQ